MSKLIEQTFLLIDKLRHRCASLSAALANLQVDIVPSHATSSRPAVHQRSPPNQIEYSRTDV